MPAEPVPIQRVSIQRAPNQRAGAAIAAATVLTLPLGSIYAFSVFLKPIEADLGIARSSLSLVFGLSTIAYLAGMNLAPLTYGLAPPSVLVALCGLLGAAGIAMSGAAQGFGTLLLGYGVLFGMAGGAGYIIVQQCANLLVRSRHGLLNGYVLSLYPGGAMIAAPLFGWTNDAFGYRVTLHGLAAALVVAGIAAGWLTARAGAELPAAGRRQDGWHGPGRLPVQARLFVVFFLSAATGLTVLSQAVGMITAYGGATAIALAAASGITGAIAGARLAGGWLVDRWPVPSVMACAHGIALSGAVLLTLWPRPLAAVAALGMIGVGTGMISGSTAGGITIYWPPAAFGRVAGRVYIAWCLAAVTLPVLAGHLYDLTHGYGTTVVIAGCGNALGVIVALGLPRERGRSRPAAVQGR